MSRHPAKNDVPLYLSDKRARKRTKRSLREWKDRCAKKVSQAEFDAAFGRRSKIVEMMAKTASGSSPKRKGRVRFTVPSSFSIIDSPERTLGAIAEFAKALRAVRPASVYVDFGLLTQYDLGANGLLDVLVDECSVEARRTRRTVRWQGNFPTHPAHVRYIRAMGVIKRLRIVHEYPSKEDEGRIALFNTRCKHYVRTLKPREADKKSKVTREFADHINRCLITIDRELTPLARSRLCQYVGEILDNAEEHSGIFDWAIQGYLDTQLPIPMCEVVIFNFGRTIAETFAELPEDSYTRKQIQKYIDLHHGRGLFGVSWRKEDLYTLISLQGNVSTKNSSPSDTRGNGTVDLIEFFQRVYAECGSDSGSDARMVIVSGSTYIQFDGTYKMSPDELGSRIIAFNAANDLTDRPDSKYVRKLSGATFPGTLIGLKFPLSTSKSTVAATGEQT